MFTAESVGERMILKIGQHLAKLLAKVGYLVFLTRGGKYLCEPSPSQSAQDVYYLNDLKKIVLTIHATSSFACQPSTVIHEQCTLTGKHDKLNS